MRLTTNQFWSLVIICWSVLTGLAVWNHIGVPIQPILTFIFMLICPGLPLVRLLRIEDHLTELVLAISLSLAAETALATTMLLFKFWSATGAFGVLMSISLVGALLQFIPAKLQSIP